MREQCRLGVCDEEDDNDNRIDKADVLVYLSTRWYARPKVRYKPSIAQFTPTSSPELDKLLDTIRHKIILPAYLPTDQRKKMFSPKYEKKLQSDPIIIEIDGEVFKFRYQNPFKDIPQTRRSVVNAVSRFEAPEDFANLRPLIEGVAYAQRHFDPSFYCKILRVLGAKGRIFDVIELARGVARSGFRLDSSEKVNEVLHWVQMKAVDADWDPAETAQAFRWAEMVLELMQEENHLPKRHKNEYLLKGELPLHRDPMVLLAPLHLAAALVSKQGAEADEVVVDKLVKYARDVVRLWPQGKKLSEVQPAALYEEYDKMGYLQEPNKYVVITAPLLRGLEIAIEALETRNPDLAAQLRSRRDILSAEVKEALGKARGNRGKAVYEKLYNNAA
ncbi:hypothetical protein Daesc_008311 [Daldinia eschscholtzii]|uniref:Uncharacterized protein n=1 Tax=Daldinia eschscholtzii TaxID=292717 RepID=A0AAX6MBC0_9PEZI